MAKKKLCVLKTWLIEEALCLEDLANGRRYCVLETWLIEGDHFESLNLLETIKIPFKSSSVYYVEGLDGFPAFGVTENAEIRAPYRLYLPNKMYRDFSILTTIKLERLDSEAFIFTVVNPSETIVQLGISIVSLQNNFVNVSLHYTDVTMHLSSQVWASFTVPEFIGNWAKLAFRVRGNEAHLYFQCEHYGQVENNRIPKELVFDSASTLYIGQAGQMIGKRFVVSYFLIR
ncbi:collagen alpha-1(XV) chain-like [Tachypleus tridentatus]|uniref:collagen alpha-1(XV) chain-like n=1 Tax=Tachypleus tridentatus TaxID=6853 RepID=UPI003FD09BCD